MVIQSNDPIIMDGIVGSYGLITSHGFAYFLITSSLLGNQLLT